jgi:hypothetical protein
VPERLQTVPLRWQSQSNQPRRGDRALNSYDVDSLLLDPAALVIEPERWLLYAPSVEVNPLEARRPAGPSPSLWFANEAGDHEGEPHPTDEVGAIATALQGVVHNGHLTVDRGWSWP